MTPTRRAPREPARQGHSDAEGGLQAGQRHQRRDLLQQRQALVGPLVRNGPASTTTVVIPKGQTSVTFDINTNANCLKVGDSKTANITAFYAQPTRGQLQVRPSGRPHPGRCIRAPPCSCTVAVTAWRAGMRATP